MKFSRNTYLKGFLVVVLLLFLVKLIFPGVTRPRTPHVTATDSLSQDSAAYALSDSVDRMSIEEKNQTAGLGGDSLPETVFFNADGTVAKHRIYSVPNFGKAFPDQNDVQLVAAAKWGVKPVDNREEAERQKGHLVYVGSNPYFYIDRLHSSIPYLVPKASILLQDIGRNFYDSLQLKGIPLHQLIVTSVLRSKTDVENLRNHNGNATQNSCHMYGTTFDVCYNRYRTVETSDENRRKVRNDTLKWVLSEVLRDMRQSNRCFVKYEVNQGCFHITVR